MGPGDGVLEVLHAIEVDGPRVGGGSDFVSRSTPLIGLQTWAVQGVRVVEVWKGLII